MRTRTSVVTATVVAAFLLAGCSASTTGEEISQNLDTSTVTEDYSGGGVAPGEMPVPDPNMGAPAVEGEIAVDALPAGEMAAPEAQRAAEATSNIVADPSTVQEKYVIRSASMMLGVDNLTQSRDKVLAIANANGGAVVNEYVYTSEMGDPAPQPYMNTTAMPEMYYYPWYDQYVDMTVKIPSDNYDRFVKDIRGIGEVVNLTQNANDVTATVYDLDARIGTARESVQRMEELMAQANTLEEMIYIEEALARRQAELESLLSQQKSLTMQSAESTVTVRMVPNEVLTKIKEETTPPEPPAPPTLWDRTVETLGDAWSNVVLFIAITSPIWVLGLLALLGVTLYKRNKKTSESKHAPQQTSPPPPPSVE